MSRTSYIKSSPEYRKRSAAKDLFASFLAFGVIFIIVFTVAVAILAGWQI